VKRIYHAYTTASLLTPPPPCSVCGRERGVHPVVDGRIVRLRAERCDVKIDRTTPWGNPFVIEKHGTRQEVIDQFRIWVQTSANPRAVWITDHVHELRGKTLGCWCAPLDCHGFVLLELAMEFSEARA
jgi:hypothetical protein